MEAIAYLFIFSAAMIVIEMIINLKEKYENLIEKTSTIVDYLVMICIVGIIGILNIGLVLLGIQNPLLNVSRICLLIYGFYIVFPCNNIAHYVLVQNNVKEKK